MGNGRAGSKGRCVASGTAASFIFSSADATEAQTSSILTTRESPPLRPSFSSTSELTPTRRPSPAKTGPPAPPSPRTKSDDDAPLDPAHGSRGRALAATERRPDCENLLPVFDGRRPQSCASQRHGRHGCRDRRIDPQHRNVAHGISQQHPCRQLDRRRELHLHRRCGADAALVRHNQPSGVDDESGGAGRRTPQRDHAVLPSHQQRRTVRLERSRGASARRGNGRDFRVLSGQLEDGVATRRDLEDLRPLYAFPWNVTG